MHTTSIDIYIQSLWRIPWIPRWHSCQKSKASRLTMIAWEQSKIMKKWPLTNALYCRLRAWQLHRMQIKMYLCCLCIDFSVSQSIDKSMRCVYGTYCMSLGSFYTPQERNTIHLSEVKIFLFSGCVYNTLHHGTLEILQLCHLEICVYTMKAHTGFTILPYTLDIEEV